MSQEQKLSAYEDLRGEANRAVWTIELQLRRISEFIAASKSRPAFVLQFVSDAEMLIIALHRLWTLAQRIDDLEPGKLGAAIASFEKRVPGLKNARDMIAHLDEYLVGKGRQRSIPVGGLRCHILKEDGIEFAGFAFNTNEALQASRELFSTIQLHPPSFYLAAVEATRLAKLSGA